MPGGLAYDSPLTKSDVDAAVATLVDQRLTDMLSSAPPKSEAKAAAAGTGAKATRDDHQHPRLTSSTTGTTAANGQATLLFTRTFTAMPSIDLCAVEDNTNPTPSLKVMRFLKQNNTATWNDGDTDPVTGCVVYASRAVPLPTMAPITGVTLLTGLVTAVNSLFGGLSGFLPTAAAANLKFTCIAVQTSSV